MTVTPLHGTTLLTDWNASPGEIFDWTLAEAITIKSFAEAQIPQVSVAVAAKQDSFAETDPLARPAKDAVLRILMVEDNRDDCDLICHRLAKCGYKPRVEIVFSEETMRAALERDSWDLIVTDHGLPGFSGLEAIALVNHLELRIPILCITGSADPLIIRRMLGAGAQTCISKNDLSLLCMAVERALRSLFNKQSDSKP